MTFDLDPIIAIANSTTSPSGVLPVSAIIVLTQATNGC